MRHLAVLIGALAWCACYSSSRETSDGGPDASDDRADDVASLQDAADHADDAGPVCGDGVVDPGEECDDRNTRPGDGCSATCTVECGDGTCQEREDQFTCPVDCGAVAVSVGHLASYAILRDGTVRCWGSVEGLCGERPAPVAGLSGVVGVSSSSSCSSSWHTCAALADGTVRCWGANAGGQLGDGTTAEAGSDVPVAALGVTTAVDVEVECGSSSALLSDGTVMCWGVPIWEDDVWSCAGGALPGPVAGLSNAVAMSPGCVLFPEGTGRCTDWSPSLDLGDAVTVSSALYPRRGCAVRTDGTVECWSVSWSTWPAFRYVAGLRTAVDVRVSLRHACAVLADGTAWCWGDNANGQLGDGTHENSHDPVPVSDLTGVVGIAVGTGACGWSCPGLGTSCAVLSDGSAWCWGAGPLGDGHSSGSDVPVRVAAW